MESTPHDAPSGAMSPDELVASHLGLVDALARKILRGLPDFVDVEDLVAFGRIGLIESSRRYDASRGVLFKTFAYYRIRGAIYDGIRKMAWFSSAPSAEVKFEAASGELLHDEAEREGGAGNLEGMIGEAREMVGNLVTARLLSLDANAIDVAEEKASALDEVEVSEVAHMLRGCLSKLEERERAVLEDYYFNHLTLEEAGAKWGLSKSWTCRLHARALKKLGRFAQEAGLGSPA
ncbi:MAG: sigma-70 family RNA polymerase sigma factor [Candidatus Eisenbacteria bacterium]